MTQSMVLAEPMEWNIGRKHLLGMTGYDDIITMIHSSIMCNITSHDTSDQVPLTRVGPCNGCGKIIFINRII